MSKIKYLGTKQICHLYQGLTRARLTKKPGDSFIPTQGINGGRGREKKRTEAEARAGAAGEKKGGEEMRGQRERAEKRRKERRGGGEERSDVGCEPWQ